MSVTAMCSHTITAVARNILHKAIYGEENYLNK